MSVKKDASGRRFIEVEVEVPGTPEEVWQAIATGPGVSSWFVPTEVREDGTVVSHFGPGMDAIAQKTAEDAPRRFAAEGEGFGPNAPPLATEWIVEARSGGACVVRVVHSLFASTDDWDNQLESLESGWPGFFRILRLYLTHFAGQYGSTLQFIGMARPPVSAAWDLLTGSLGFQDATQGRRWNTPTGLPALGGWVEQAGDDEHPHLLLRLDEPTPGIAHLFVLEMCGQVYVTMRLYLYGDQAHVTTKREEALWQRWMQQHFPVLAGEASSA
jgi:uncharacterized protein YndB with AHSA1/START domain